MAVAMLRSFLFSFCEKTVEPQLQSSCEQLSRVIPGSWDHREPGAMARLKALSSLASLRNRSTVMTGQLTLWAVAERVCCQCSLSIVKSTPGHWICRALQTGFFQTISP